MINMKIKNVIFTIRFHKLLMNRHERYFYFIIIRNTCLYMHIELDALNAHSGDMRNIICNYDK